jgi:hypothetical protein
MEKKDLIYRLAFIKYLFKTGVNHSNLPSPMAFPSILLFHDSIELFFCLALEHLGRRDMAQINFDNYPTSIERKLNGEKISNVFLIQQLNRSRVNLKHNFFLPEKVDIDKFSSSLPLFFEENCQTIFDLSFEEIS